jgi:hypothetical protein
MFFSGETIDALEVVLTRLRVATLFIQDKEREDLAKEQISVSASQLLTLLQDDRPRRRKPLIEWNQDDWISFSKEPESHVSR